jgi:DNA-binding HxlR family transcriptional regulator
MNTKLKLSNHTTKNGYKLIELYYYNQGKGVVLDTDVHVIEKFFDEAAVMKVSSKVQTHVEDITDKMLSKELKDLEINQLVERTVYDTFPPTVEYAITDHGKTLQKVIAELGLWGLEHRRKIIGK